MMSDPEISVRVECYAGHRGEETPQRFFLDGHPIEIAEVVDQWLAPDHRYFKLRDLHGATWILRNDTRSGHWELTMYQRSQSDAYQ